jgi:hypothetical protein
MFEERLYWPATIVLKIWGMVFGLVRHDLNPEPESGFMLGGRSIRRRGVLSLLNASRRNPFGRSRGRHIVIHSPLQIIRDISGGFFEFLDPASKATGEFGQLLGAEEHENHGQDENELPSTNDACEKCIHKSTCQD